MTATRLEIKSFVLKGGPQSGKSTILRELERVLGDQIIVVPEVATVLLTHLWPKRELVGLKNDMWMQTLQHGIFHTQQGLERLARSRAQAGGQKLIGHDRGVFDNAGYLVIHLDTLAKLHPEQFGSETNEARYETPEEAIQVDEQIWCAYEEHPHQVRISACDDFAAKTQQVVDLVQALLV